MKAMTFYYFAYGSNMLTERLKDSDRCPGATTVGRAFADDWGIEFSKLSQDESGKATLRQEVGRRTAGVLYEIPGTQRCVLDSAEGDGYKRCDAFPVHRSDSDEIVQAVTYLAKSPQPNLKPYDWYLALVIAGARQHRLGDDYLAELRCVPYLTDFNDSRKTRAKAIEVLTAAGSPKYRRLLCQTRTKPQAS